MEKILVLDFGGQYNQLIARRVREEHVYAEIKPYNKITVQEIRQIGYKGIIFTGGPNSVYDAASPHYDPEVLNIGIPILGICYGDQLMAYMAGGKVDSAENSSEYGKTAVFTDDSILFEGVPSESICWMSHTDFIKIPPLLTLLLSNVVLEILEFFKSKMECSALLLTKKQFSKVLEPMIEIIFLLVDVHELDVTFLRSAPDFVLIFMKLDDAIH